MYKDYLKPANDWIAALILLVICSPVIILISILIIILNRSQPFFIQHRPGKNEKLFKLIKFRSMTDQKDADGNLLDDHLRVTKLGQFIRKTSLDELPELFNILKGEMSFVGPRPLLVEYLEMYTEKQRLRHLVKPGITGLAQVSGRNLLSWDEKFELDLHYIENLSFLNDILIMFKTCFVIFNTSTVNQSSVQTMEKFKGSNDQSCSQIKLNND